ncbi:MAG: ligase-associated DNA damage response exonuclease [Flammeovirgaceae bacterium]
MKDSLIVFNENGIFCPAGNFYIDPWKPVQDAIITHAHTDHARWGHQNYLAQKNSENILYQRLGKDICLQTLDYGESIIKNGVKISLHPAGHIIGSAQVRIEYKGQVCVVSGDYKTENDGISTAFQPLKCHEFLTESTFGLPVYQWKPQKVLFQEINEWWAKNQKEGKVSIILAYALGKAQRILSGLEDSIGKVYVHGTIWNTLEALKNQFKTNYAIHKIDSTLPKNSWKGGIIIAPPAVEGSVWLQKFQPYSLAVASGWMAIRGIKRRRLIDRGFVMSDHADWHGLLTAIKATEAEKVYVTHGYSAIFSKYLTETGIEAIAAETLFEGESAEGDI